MSAQNQQNQQSQQNQALPIKVNASVKDVAARFFLDLSFGRHRTLSPQAVAAKAIGMAMAFESAVADIESGRIPLPVHKAAEEPLYCRVHLWDGSRGPFGEPMVNENTGEPVYEVQPIDRWAHAPNLPESHPINQRYEPIARRLGILCDRSGKLLASDKN